MIITRLHLATALIALVGCGGGAPPPKTAPAASGQTASAQTASSDPPKIVMFYPGSAAVEKGKPGLLCFGVENATEVRLTPPVESLKPSPNRCFEVKPDRTTKYTLEARDAQGRSVSQSVTLTVVAGKTMRPPAAAPAPAPDSGAAGPRIVSFRLDRKEAASANLCYEVTGAQTVSVDPAALPQVRALRGCFLVAPKTTTTYTLNANSQDGRTVKQQLTVTMP